MTKFVSIMIGHMKIPVRSENRWFQKQQVILDDLHGLRPRLNSTINTGLLWSLIAKNLIEFIHVLLLSQSTSKVVKYVHNLIPFLDRNELLETTMIQFICQNVLSTYKLKTYQLSFQITSIAKLQNRGCQIQKHKRQPLVIYHFKNRFSAFVLLDADFTFITNILNFQLFFEFKI